MSRLLFFSLLLLLANRAIAQPSPVFTGEWAVNAVNGLPPEPGANSKKTVDALLKSRFRFDKDGRFTLTAPEKSMAVTGSNWKYDPANKTITIDQADMSGDFVIVMKILVRQEKDKLIFLPDIYPYELEMKQITTD